MIIVYSPAGGTEAQFDVRKLLTSEASIAQKTVDRKWAEIKAGIANDDPESMRVVAWLLSKRANPPLRYKDFDPAVEELAAYLDRPEVERFLAETFRLIRQNPELPAEAVEQTLARCVAEAHDKEHAEALIRDLRNAEAAVEGEDPKEPASESELSSERPDGDESPSPTLTSTSAESSTSGSSPISSTLRPETSTV